MFKGVYVIGNYKQHGNHLYNSKMFELNAISKKHGQVLALNKVSLQFEIGQSIALIGPHGSGKSSLLRIFLGLDEPDSGEMRFNGVRVFRRYTHTHTHPRVGYMVRGGGLFPYLTAEQNIALPTYGLGWTETKISICIAELADKLQLSTSILQKFPGELTDEQRYCVGVLRALILEPSALLFDDPLSGLDSMIRYKRQRQLQRLFSIHKQVVVLATNDIAEAIYLADTLVILRAGSVVQQGTAQELLNSPVEPFVRDFILAQRSFGEGA